MVVACLFGGLPALAAEVQVRVDNPPTNGTVVVWLFNSADTFVDLRDPVRVVTLASGGARSGRIADLPGGEYALVVYHDENGNGQLDRNFIGIPREPLGFSNRYWPEGPPSFSRAAFRLSEGATTPFDVELKPVFGKRGLFGIGLGVIFQTSPYRDARHVRVLPIPVVSYIGDRVQIFGPGAQCGIVSSDKIRLALTAAYRFGAYREDDSDYLRGMGDRDDTLFGGGAVQAELPAGIELSAGYEHDLLDRTGGGVGRMGVGRAFQRGLTTVTPNLAANWISGALANYDFGVPEDRAMVWRPAYDPGDAVTLETGVSLFRELRGKWRIFASGTVTFLPSEITGSPIVERSRVYSSFVAINRLF